jgi:hypothetical protein
MRQQWQKEIRAKKVGKLYRSILFCSTSSKSFFPIFLVGESVLAAPLLMSPILYF